jgi:hypothetical protein
LPTAVKGTSLFIRGERRVAEVLAVGLYEEPVTNELLPQIRLASREGARLC